MYQILREPRCFPRISSELFYVGLQHSIKAFLIVFHSHLAITFTEEKIKVLIKSLKSSILRQHASYPAAFSKP